MNIRVVLNTPIKDGTEVVFRSPVDCSQITGLILYYNGESKEFAFADAHGNNVGDIDHLFAENAVVKVILDVSTNMAFVQNADTNAYLEGRLAECLTHSKQPLTPEQQAQARENIGAADGAELADAQEKIADIAENFKKSRNILDPDKIINGYYDNGAIVASASYCITDLIAVTPGASYYFSFPCHNSTYTNAGNIFRFAAFYDQNKKYVSRLENAKAFTSPDTVAYVRLTINVSMITTYNAAPQLFEGAFSGVNVNTHPYGYVGAAAPVNGELLIDGTVTAAKLGRDIVTNGKNLFNKDTVVSGILHTSVIAIEANTVTVTSDFIPVKAGTIYTVSPNLRRYHLYDMNKDAVLQNSDAANTQGAVTIAVESDGYLRVSVYAANLDVTQIEEGAAATAFEPYKWQLADGIALSQEQIAKIPGNGGNVLYGKKWVACGDSFTEGIAAGQFTDGRFVGKYKSYPYLVGVRNNMEIVNLARGGMSMAAQANSTNYFSNTAYKNIDADADYITIKLGINDANYNSPVGAIDDADNTTFYGAWNMVLEHIIVNHPTAKIGIIVTNGSRIEYANATIAIAEKWGIPYLNEATGVLVPTMHRSNKTLPASVVEARLNAFAADRANGDTHPNAAGHEYESTFVEHFLRSL